MVGGKCVYKISVGWTLKQGLSGVNMEWQKERTQHPWWLVPSLGRASLWQQGKRSCLCLAWRGGGQRGWRDSQLPIWQPGDAVRTCGIGRGPCSGHFFVFRWMGNTGMSPESGFDRGKIIALQDLKHKRSRCLCSDCLCALLPVGSPSAG